METPESWSTYKARKAKEAASVATSSETKSSSSPYGDVEKSSIVQYDELYKSWET